MCWVAVELRTRMLLLLEGLVLSDLKSLLIIVLMQIMIIVISQTERVCRFLHSARKVDSIFIEYVGIFYL